MLFVIGSRLISVLFDLCGDMRIIYLDILLCICEIFITDDVRD